MLLADRPQHLVTGRGRQDRLQPFFEVVVPLGADEVGVAAQAVNLPKNAATLQSGEPGLSPNARE
ncbi:MAG TPA: hypothetical protein PKW35_06900, partial [Nannocystaceae bacterium]|nr:hypothetical protein [Nannocystaceae bacterium]